MGSSSSFTVAPTQAMSSSNSFTDNSINTPLAPTNCDYVANSLLQNPAGGCICREGYRWTGSTCSIDCALVANSKNIQLSPDSCECNPGYVWSTTYAYCLPADPNNINCSQIKYSNSTNANASNCTCKDKYSFVIGLCVLDCANVPNSDTTNNNFESFFTCFCTGNLKFYQESCRSQSSILQIIQLRNQ